MLPISLFILIENKLNPKLNLIIMNYAYDHYKKEPDTLITLSILTILLNISFTHYPQHETPTHSRHVTNESTD